MIVPLEVKIEPIVRPEDYDVDQVVEFGKSIPGPPVYRVQAVALDTESDEVKTYDLHTLVDYSREPPGIGTITHSPLEANREYLTRLRDQLSEVLS